jgi:head-tail adaptor
MSFGKMNKMIGIVQAGHTKDAEGFATEEESTLASVRAYKEDRHGTERWAGLAAFSAADAIFRFRAIPGLSIRTSMLIICEGERYRILSAENVRGRGRYVEALTEKIEMTVR